jgi:putative transcriptional regulator
MTGFGRAAHPSGNDSSMVGQLLVSPPSLSDPNFQDTVVLIMAHSVDGAFGLILNRPSTLGSHDALAIGGAWTAWDSWTAAPEVVFLGGPVEPGMNLMLGRSTGAAPWAWLLDEIGTVDVEDSPDDVVGLQSIRIFTGYSGWGPGQLEAEVAAGAWFVIDAEPADVFTDEPEELWSDVLRRNGGNMALISNHAVDPTWN